jgi:hypothetical protein
VKASLSLSGEITILPPFQLLAVGWRWLTNYRAPSIGSPLSQGVVTWCSNLLKTLQELHGAPPNWRSLSKKFQRVFSRVQQTKRARVVVWLASSNSTLSSWIKWKKEERKKDQIPPYIYTQGRARSDVNIFVCSIRSFKRKFKKKKVSPWRGFASFHMAP